MTIRRITASVSLLAGAAIYMLFRPRHLVGFVVLDSIGLETWVNNCRQLVPSVQLPEFMIYCLPNGLWSLSYVLLIDEVVQAQRFCTKLIWASVIPVIGVISEFMQLWGIIPGRYDLGDVICYITPVFLYSCFAFAYMRKVNKSPS